MKFYVLIEGTYFNVYNAIQLVINGLIQFADIHDPCVKDAIELVNIIREVKFYLLTVFPEFSFHTNFKERYCISLGIC